MIVLKKIIQMTPACTIWCTER